MRSAKKIFLILVLLLTTVYINYAYAENDASQLLNWIDKIVSKHSKGETRAVKIKLKPLYLESGVEVNDNNGHGAFFYKNWKYLLEAMSKKGIKPQLWYTMTKQEKVIIKNGKPEGKFNLDSFSRVNILLAADDANMYLFPVECRKITAEALTKDIAKLKGSAYWQNVKKYNVNSIVRGASKLAKNTQLDENITPKEAEKMLSKIDLYNFFERIEAPAASVK